LYYVTPGQIAGILPSNTPVGTGTLTINNNGQSSAPAPITVVRSAFGAVSLDGSGTGVAAAYDVNWRLLSKSAPAKPGDVVQVFGSGVGPLPTGDDSTQPPQMNLTQLPLTVEVAGVASNILYRGRTVYPGVDQINFTVPAGVRMGCEIPVVVKTGTNSSNVTTIPISTNGGPCPPPADVCALNYMAPALGNGIIIPSPDGTMYLVNRDDANGISQVYVGRSNGGGQVCISCSDKANGPKGSKRKMQAHWHPSGRWIVMAVEQDDYAKPPLATPEIIEGLLQSGIWVDMWATNPDGSKWYKLQDFGSANPADGFTGVAFTPDGRTGVWAQIVDGNVFAYTFGKWQLIAADFTDANGVPQFTGLRNITPPDTYWLEPGNFSPNGKDLLLSADQGFPNHANVAGQDQFILDIQTGKMTNLTKSPDIWDEHGLFSPDGQKVVFMSSYPYRSDPKASTTLGLKTEFMIMDKDGSNLRQVTHFNEPGYPESSTQSSVAAVAGFSADGSTLLGINLIFPKYAAWQIKLQGNCGNRAAAQ